MEPHKNPIAQIARDCAFRDDCHCHLYPCCDFRALDRTYGEAEVFAQPYAPWGGEHLLGTDQIGRDIYSRMIYGARKYRWYCAGDHHLAFVIGGGLGLAAAINHYLAGSTA